MEISIRELSWVVEMAVAARESSAREMLQGHWHSWAKPWGKRQGPHCSRTQLHHTGCEQRRIRRHCFCGVSVRRCVRQVPLTAAGDQGRTSPLCVAQCETAWITDRALTHGPLPQPSDSLCGSKTEKGWAVTTLPPTQGSGTQCSYH